MTRMQESITRGICSPVFVTYSSMVPPNSLGRPTLGTWRTRRGAIFTRAAGCMTADPVALGIEVGGGVVAGGGGGGGDPNGVFGSASLDGVDAATTKVASPPPLPEVAERQGEHCSCTDGDSKRWGWRGGGLFVDLSDAADWWFARARSISASFACITTQRCISCVYAENR